MIPGATLPISPIFFNNKFIGRLDAKADRKIKIFTVKNIWFENNFKPTPEFKKELNLQLNAFALFCGCIDVVS